MSDTRQGNDPALDGLRGLAVLIVLLSHMANAGMPVLPGFSLSGIGKSGVYLFFVLSAFLLTRLLLAKPAEAWRRTATWADYALRRTLRIVPLYLVVLGTSAAITAAGVAPWWPYPMPADALVRHLLLQAGVNVLWSIPVEFHYYLWLPVVAGGLATAERAGGWMLATAVALGGAAAAMAIWPPGESLVNDVRLGPYLVLFIGGALAAVFSNRWAATPPPAAIVSAFGALALLMLVATIPAVAARSGVVGWTPELNHRWFAFFALAWATLVLAVVHGGPRLRRFFALAPLRALGWVSFSAYLWHMPVLSLVRGPLALDGWAALAAFVTGTALVSWASWRAIERPMQRVRWASGPSGPSLGERKPL